MTKTQTQTRIQHTLGQFKSGSLRTNALQLFDELGYRSERQLLLQPNNADTFRRQFVKGKPFREDKALIADWQSVDVLFQLTDGDIQNSSQLQIFDSSGQIDNQIINSYLFMAVALTGDSYTRTQLAQATREINKLFPMPVMLLFQHGDTLTFSIINRRLNLRDRSKDVLEKVTLIKDIACAQPHRAHLEILYDLSLDELHRVHDFDHFVGLHNAWQKTLDSSELNKRFFKEIANWYFWAVATVTFPKDAGPAATRSATSVIRLITRLIFVWFLKEKGLVPDTLFNRREVDRLLTWDDAQDSTYYKAILQNLFFATLNQEMNTPQKPDNRKFRGTRQTGQDQHYMIHNVYRYQRYFTDPDAALKLFAEIPFLNGGLFECLDKKVAGKTVRVDGFSDRPDNPLHVPDELFWGGERNVDLNDIYDTSGRGYKVQGLINILNRYKFTITENTPIEEEIALDPELLGKVFENLLAAYNPETDTTARKQTGSFYTPREIVNYMVDESLIAHLKTELAQRQPPEGSKPPEGSEKRLRHLFAYNEEPHQFSPAEVSRLVHAIDHVNILDPACGSGAFPMGILHKLVFILGKLDPGNEQWKKQQLESEIQPLQKDIQIARRISDEEAREAAIQQLKERIEDIEEKFKRNEQDYPRKLFLIENCIYGVDIQPIAVQIAKLRFFISLVVDQRIDDAIDNRGILPLPNLETKFVAANTLFKIDKPKQMALRNPEITQKEQELADVRSRHFRARTPQTKAKRRAEDKQLRAEISKLLQQEGGLRNEDVKRLAEWDPYNQNFSADFFDSEWMFGLDDGFSIVIGNPPYVRVDNIPKSIKAQYKKNFKSASGKYDLYYLFFEQALDVLGEASVCSFITPNKFCAATSAKNLREILFKECAAIEIVSTSHLGVFDDAANYPIICILQRGNQEASIRVRQAYSLRQLSRSHNKYELTATQTRSLPDWVIPINKSQTEIALTVKCLALFNSLGNYFSISEGLRIPKSKEVSERNDYHIVKQYQIERYGEIQEGSYITKNNLRKILRPGTKRHDKIFQEKILLAEDALQITATLDKDMSIPQGGIYFGVVLQNDLKIESVLALLNSKLFSFLYEVLYGGMHMGGGYLRYRTSFLEKLPFPNLREEQQTYLYKRVSKILSSNNKSTTTKMELDIDRFTYNIFGLDLAEIIIIEGEELNSEKASLLASNPKMDDTPITNLTEAFQSHRFTGQSLEGSFVEKRAYLELLTKQATPAAMQDLVAALTDDNLTIRWQAATALRTIGGPQVTGILQSFIEQTDSATGKQAAQELLTKLQSWAQ